MRTAARPRADRALRGAGLCVRGEAGGGRKWRGRLVRMASLCAAGGDDCGSGSRTLLARRSRLATRWRSTGKAALRVLSSNAGHALFAGIASPERAARLATLLPTSASSRLGRQDDRRRRGALQSDVLSQRLGVAARQCPDRDGPRALRPRGEVLPISPGPRRGGVQRRVPPAAGAVLRLLAPQDGARPTIRSLARRRRGRRRRPLPWWRRRPGSNRPITRRASGSKTPRFPPSSTIWCCTTCGWPARGSTCTFPRGRRCDDGNYAA